MGLLIEALDILFNKPTSPFVNMKAIDFIDRGFEVHCNHSAYAAKVACSEFHRHKMLKVLNEKKTLIRYRWFDVVCLKSRSRRNGSFPHKSNFSVTIQHRLGIPYCVALKIFMMLAE